MKIASYQRGGVASFGIVTDAGLVDLPRRLARGTDLRTALELPGGLDVFRPFERDAPDFALSDVAFLPVVPKPDKIVGIGINYRDHAAELGSTLPDHPVVFIRWPSSVVGHLNPLVRPRASDRFDFEGELAVVIGRPARHVPRSRALDYVAGYSCFQDGSVRDWQRHTSQFGPGKNFVATGALGPWLTTADAVPDPGRLAITTRLNGKVVQDGTTGDMLFDVAAIIEYVTTFTELRAGDIIATGTPKGVGEGRKPPLYMKAGDVVEVAIAGLGTLRNPVADEG